MTNGKRFDECAAWCDLLANRTNISGIEKYGNLASGMSAEAIYQMEKAACEPFYQKPSTPRIKKRSRLGGKVRSEKLESVKGDFLNNLRNKKFSTATQNNFSSIFFT